jgi:acetolactate synthase I/II/III large subunit
MVHAMKVSDLIAQTLVQHGVRHVFMVTGGGAMHLNDSIAYQAGITPVFCHHEQACAMAAEGYSRIHNTLGVINVTTGPGGINALNGVFGAWTDSIPMLILSGQVKRETTLTHHGLVGHLRQLGDQEVDIASMVQGICKGVFSVHQPDTILEILEEAIHLSQTGRPGPVWIDIPIDVQAALVETATLKRFQIQTTPKPNHRNALDRLFQALQSSQRPVLFLGNGVRLSKAHEDIIPFLERLGIPVVTAFNAHDLLASHHPLYAGRPGTIGTRPGNFVVQQADLLIVLGCRLNIRQVSYNYPTFAKHARIFQIDIDPAELDKPLVQANVKICMDALDFVQQFQAILKAKHWDPSSPIKAWVLWAQQKQQRYPAVLAHMKTQANGVFNPYYFLDTLIRKATPRDTLVCANATACVVSFQVAHLQYGTRLFSNSGSASMGFDLPAAIGAAFADRNRRVICLAGDGSLQMNIQELQTLVHYQLPIKLIVLNNQGYLSMRLTQDNFFKRRVGEGRASGVSFPDFVAVAQAYGLAASRLEANPENPQAFIDTLDAFLATDHPEVLEVMLDPNQPFEPKLSAKPLPNGSIVSPELDDMFPFLSAEELSENRQVPLEI